MITDFDFNQIATIIIIEGETTNQSHNIPESTSLKPESNMT